MRMGTIDAPVCVHYAPIMMFTKGTESVLP
jgi:hypothetical protein